jgi:hypothetical protein
MLFLPHNKRRRLHCLVKAVVTAYAPLDGQVFQLQMADVPVSPPLLLPLSTFLPANAVVSSLVVKAW